MQVAVWRIARKPYALDRDGAGAKEAGGRWNRPGTGVVYAGASVSVVALEKFVHLVGVVPADLVLVRLDLPENFSEEVLDQPPRGWNLTPPEAVSMDLGTIWAQEKRSLALKVPSVLVPEEYNILLNPEHTEFSEVLMTIVRPFAYDLRMYGERISPSRRLVFRPKS